jgi:hypothetical protein
MAAQGKAPTASEGQEFRNISGVTLYGLIPPDAVAFVRQTDPNNEDTAHAGTLVLECDIGDGIGASAGITAEELAANWEAVS